MLSHSTLDDIQYSQYPAQIQQSYSETRIRHVRSLKRKKRKKLLSKRYNSCKSDQKCAVCLSESTILDTKLFPCRHAFHGECLIKWVKTGQKFNCPLCRQNITHFIQRTNNQDINNQLLTIWNNHHYSDIDDYNANIKQKKIQKSQQYTTKIKEEKDKEIILKHTTPTTTATATATIEPVVEEKEEESIIIDADIDNDNGKTSSIISSDHSTWESISNTLKKPNNSISTTKYLIFNSSLISSYIHTNNDIYQPQIIDIDNFDIHKSSFSIPSGLYTKRSVDVVFEQQSDIQVDTNNDNDKYIDNDNNDSLSSFISLNFRSGVSAGVCAGTTTYLITSSIGLRIFNRNALSLFPILYETIPSVALFFTSYEYLKKYLFNVNNETKSYSITFAERFLSAGLASSCGYVLPRAFRNNINCGYLPLRFATFFGTFELCKDLINKNQEKLNFFQVASSAAIGGTISHSLYYPITQYKNVLVLNTCNNTNVGNIGIPGRRYLYRGWFSSFSKFLPPCVVCSCAFEYAKRYLNS